MTEPRQPPGPGVLDQRSWAPQLAARAIEKVPDGHRLHGYHVLGDLAQHYDYSDVVFLSITGELPDPRSSRLFRIALAAATPVWIADASAHGAVLARVSAASVPTSLAVGVIGAAAEIQDLVGRHSELFTWLAAPTAEAPASCRDAAGGAASALLAAVHAIEPQVDSLRADMTLDAAVIALLVAAGIRTPDQVMGALMIARVCGLSAEILATGPQHFWDYPVQTPPMVYVEP